MKIAVYEYKLRQSIRSTVTGFANAAEIAVKKITFGNDVLTVSSEVTRIDDVDPQAEVERISRFLSKDEFEKIFGLLPEDWVAFIKKFEYKQKAAAKRGSKSKNQAEEVTVEEDAE